MMKFSPPALHPRVLVLPEHLEAAEKAIYALRAVHALEPVEAAVAGDIVRIPLTTVSLKTNFDACVEVAFHGEQTGRLIEVDSGNSNLVVLWKDIEARADWKFRYEILGTGWEPWGCPANVVRGPITIGSGGRTITIDKCVFYACTAPNENDKWTKNFGAGCLSPYPQDKFIAPDKTTKLQMEILPPLAYAEGYPYAVFDYAGPSAVLSLTNSPRVAGNSYLSLHKKMPPGYTMFDIVERCSWMALQPKSLTIHGIKTEWPDEPGIAMVDTGGGPVFLGDPGRKVCNQAWPGVTCNPNWITEDGAKSKNCQTTATNITVELTDGHTSFAYTIDTANMAKPVQGETLVMCEENEFMRGKKGMNIGGLSALFVSILVDYDNAKVGLRLK